MSKIITFFNQKGGCGKTTIAMNVAAVLSVEHSAKVLLIDGDSQGSAVRWVALSDEDKPFPCAVVSLSHIQSKVHQEIKKFLDDYEYIIVDCPPSIESKFSESALIVTDLAVLPVIPSPNDYFSVAGAERLLDRLSEINERLESRVVINCYQHGIKMSVEMEQLLGEINIKLFLTRIGQRTSYRQAIAKGGSVLDMADNKAKNEIKNLVKEIINILNK
jgi:chromosome partitioning protein